MHELSLLQGVLDSVTPVAKDAGATRVTQITLDIGEMTQVVDEAMDFGWSVLTEDDPLYQGAKLVVNHIDASSLCFDCGEEFSHDRFHMRCPKCGSGHTVIKSGKEMSIASIEIETPDDQD